MSSSFFNLGIIRESRNDETRTPLIPKHIKELKKKFNNVKIVIQPSSLRCFKDKEYLSAGATISEDLSSSDLILGVKEVDTRILIANKNYLFFSHTSKIQSDNSAAAQGTPGMNKKDLLKAILDKNIKLIDYENIRSSDGSRYLGFGRFAGIIGCYNSLCLFEYFLYNFKLPRAYELNNYLLLKKTIKNRKFSKMRILITGDGRVAKGVLELIQFTNIKQISKEDFLYKDYNEPVFCNLRTADYVSCDQTNIFNLEHFIRNKEKYKSTAEKYLKKTNLLISAHYWDPLSPKIFTIDSLDKFNHLKVIGDITCDINGSIPTTLKSTSIKNPYFYYDKNNKIEIKQSDEALAIMAVDNLPSELPKDSSEEFGDGIIQEVLPYIINKDDGRIINATIAQNGKFLTKYQYLENYIKI
jgi:saccharopine dehydrogenase (NAD+, L-lysine-forming)